MEDIKDPNYKIPIKEAAEAFVAIAEKYGVETIKRSGDGYVSLTTEIDIRSTEIISVVIYDDGIDIYNPTPLSYSHLKTLIEWIELADEYNAKVTR